MTSRTLPSEEWSTLAFTELGPMLQFLRPGSTQVVVVEHDGRVIARWIAMPVWHVEGLYIDPAYRGTAGVIRRLWTGMRAALQAAGVTAALTGAETDQIRGFLSRVGAPKVPFDHYLVNFAPTEVRSCR